MKAGLRFSVLTVILLLPALTLGVELRDEVYRTKGGGKVVFRHARHLAAPATRNNCKACHPSLFPLGHAPRTTMAAMQKGASCGACHDGRAAFALSRCSGCHDPGEVVFQVKEAGPTRFNHARHAGKHECGACHPRIFRTGGSPRATMADMAKKRSCGACHDGRNAFGLNRCGGCHPTRDVTFRVAATGPTRFSHRTHTTRSSCGACHPARYSFSGRHGVTMAQMKEGVSCGGCHDGKAAFPVTQCRRCHPAPDRSYPAGEFSAARFTHRTHTAAFSCARCHPAIYPQGVRRVPVKMEEMERGKSCGACHDGKKTFSVRENCESCHPHGQQGAQEEHENENVRG